jgi:hypothetical protein
MAGKKTNGKSRPKRTAPKAKAKTKLKTAPKAKAKSAGKVSKPAPRPKTKPKAKRTTKRPQRAPTAPSSRPESISAADAPAVEVAALEGKKGRLARIAGGVGNLFARMTGKKAESDQAADDTPAPDQTMELASGDILASMDAPPPSPKQKS